MFVSGYDWGVQNNCLHPDCKGSSDLYAGEKDALIWACMTLKSKTNRPWLRSYLHSWRWPLFRCVSRRAIQFLRQKYRGWQKLPQQRGKPDLWSLVVTVPMAAALSSGQFCSMVLHVIPRSLVSNVFLQLPRDCLSHWLGDHILCHQPGHFWEWTWGWKQLYIIPKAKALKTRLM